MSDARSFQEELAEIAASVRALLEWQESTGASGIPRDPHPPARASQRSAVEPAPELAPAARAVAPRAPVADAPEPSEPAEPAPEAAPAAAAAAPLAVAPAPSGDRPTRLALVAEEVRTCTRCGLHAGRKQTVFARGNPMSELVFIGEGPGADEDAQGEPFVGRAGQLLDRMILAMGYARDDVYICNVVKCRPPENRKPEPIEMETCMPFLARQLEIVEPRAIVALGATAVQGLLGTTEGITRLRGKWKLYKGRVPVMPTFHPAYLLRTPSAKREVWADLQEVMRVLGKAPPPRTAG